MKKILSLLALAAMTLSASAQFVAPPVVKSAITNITIAVNGITTSNIVTAGQTFPIIVGAGGFGVGFNMAGSAAATTTNCTFRFDVSGDGVNWVTDAVTITAAPAGTGYTPTYTNVLSSAANIGNLVHVRLRSIQNTNTGTLYITNLTISTR